MKKKIYIVIILVVLVTFFSGITYSFFNSSAVMKSTNQGIASFVFEANNLDHIDLNLNGLIPGEEKEYLFSVANATEEIVSDVTVEYQLIINTYHFIPLTIDLYEMIGETEDFVGTCDEKSSRNTDKELVCKMPINTLENSIKEVDNYKLKITFPEEYNDPAYSNLVDYINIEIESWQKIQEVTHEEQI